MSETSEAKARIRAIGRCYLDAPEYSEEERHLEAALVSASLQADVAADEILDEIVADREQPSPIQRETRAAWDRVSEAYKRGAGKDEIRRLTAEALAVGNAEG